MKKTFLIFSAFRKFSEHEFEEDQTSREEGDGVGDGREVRSSLLVGVLSRKRRVQLSGERFNVLDVLVKFLV